MRRLPLVTEKALASTRNKQAEISDDFLRRLDHEAVTCRKGCHHCCYHPVAISLLEGALLYLGLKAQGLWTQELRNTCEERASLVTGLPPETWMLAKVQCPLLREGICMSYNNRPLVCRTTFSTGLPELCDPHNFSTDTPLVPRLEELTAFQAYERQLLRGLATYRTMPLALAVLLGERVATGRLDLETSDAAILLKYLEAYK